MGKKHRRKKSLWIILWILVGGLLVLGIPMLINEAYKFGLNHTPLYTTVWDGKDVLTYYGSLVGAVGTIIGVYFSIKAAYKNYQDDVRNRSLPFFALDVLGRKSRLSLATLLGEKTQLDEEKQPNLSDNEYAEERLKQVYFTVEADRIVPKYDLEKKQQEILKHSGMIVNNEINGNRTIKCIDYISIPLEIENVGNGAAINLRIGLNRILKDTSKYKFIRSITLKKDEKFYIHIFSDAPYEDIKGEYVLTLHYDDILGNTYYQDFPIYFEKKDEKLQASINPVGKQMNGRKE